jgi:hypothetical protein
MKTLRDVWLISFLRTIDMTIARRKLMRRLKEDNATGTLSDPRSVLQKAFSGEMNEFVSMDLALAQYDAVSGKALYYTVSGN